jgi:hypothetical protein
MWQKGLGASLALRPVPVVPVPVPVAPCGSGERARGDTGLHNCACGQDAPQPGMAVHACNPSPREAEAGGLRVRGQPGLQRETLPQKPPLPTPARTLDAPRCLESSSSVLSQGGPPPSLPNELLPAC